jgi:hypothetical protein
VPRHASSAAGIAAFNSLGLSSGHGTSIAEDRILTARHVLFGDRCDETADFELRWHHWRDSGKPAGQWQRVSRERIISAGSDALDAAVIAHPFATEVNTYFPLTARNHATGACWESEGFADVGKREDNSREAVPMRGSTYRYASRARDAWLDVAAPTVSAQWKGASGSPVILLSQVAGILTEVPAGFAGGRLKALPAARLLADKRFREAIGYRAGADRGAALVAMLESVRDRHSRAIGALECGIEGTGGALWRDPAKPVDALAEALSDCNVTELLRFAYRAIAALKPKHAEDARVLGELVQRLLPILYDHTAVDAVRARVDDPSAVLVGLPVATAYVAEAVMAGADGRETRWQPPRPRREMEGSLCLPNTPNDGIDPNGERKLESFREHLRRKLCVNQLTEFESAFYRCLSEFITDDERARFAADEQDELYGAAADELAYLAQQNSRYYYLFQLPREPEHRDQVLATLARLKGKFPAVAFMELALDGKLLRAERKDFRPLQDILNAMEP